MKKLSLFLISCLVCMTAFASDYHQRGQRHRVVYVVSDSSGNPVSGQTLRLKVQRVSDDAVFDFSDQSFKFSGWTSKTQTMAYNSEGEYYSYTFTQDAARFNSGDYVCIVSNDDATYGDQQAEVVAFDTLADQIRVNR